MVRRPLGNHHFGPDTLLVTSDTRQTGPGAAENVNEIENEIENDLVESLRQLIAPARVVLWDFDGPICRLFAGYSAERVAIRLVDWLEGRGLHGLLTDRELESLDPHQVLRAVDRRHSGSDLVAELEERLTQEELRAVPRSMPTPYADILIQTWKAVGSRLAITTNNSPKVVRTYLAGRNLTRCFTPHVYGRTQDLHLLKPDPHCLNRALNAMGAAPSAALMIGDTPSDYFAAREAGVPFLGYARNEEKEKTLRAAGAETMVDSLAPVLRAVRRQARAGQA
ncbi:HAD family hydrolase [Streptomyces sp. NBC_00075]|uniref:HAD family hydrolase n=1 Tax=Streptomyces TaxID=1883 RepID=UPI003868165D